MEEEKDIKKEILKPITKVNPKKIRNYKQERRDIHLLRTILCESISRHVVKYTGS
jgi:hypothetical protein